MRSRDAPPEKPLFIRKWREHRGLTRQQVVDRIQRRKNIRPIDQATLAKWESGEVPLLVSWAKALARVYGVELADLCHPPVTPPAGNPLFKDTWIVPIELPAANRGRPA